MSTIDKVVTKIVYNKEQKRYMTHRKTMTFNYDGLTQSRIGANPIKTKIDWIELPSCLKKEVNVPIILKKTATNYETFETIQAYFSSSVKVKVINESIYAHQYLSVDRNRVYLHNISSGQTCPIALSGSNQIGTIKEFSKTEKKLTTDEAVKLMNEGIGVYEKLNDNEVRVLI